LPVVPALHVQANKILALKRCTEEGQALCPLPAPLHALGFQDPEQRANKVLTHEGGTHVSTLRSIVDDSDPALRKVPGPDLDQVPFVETRGR
jgi:hypothetical protein